MPRKRRSPLALVPRNSTHEIERMFAGVRARPAAPRPRRRATPSFPNSAADPLFFHTLRLHTRGRDLVDPFVHHPWVYAPYQVTATTLAGLPWTIVKEVSDDTSVDERRRRIARHAPRISDGEAQLIARQKSGRVRARLLHEKDPLLSPIELERAATGIEVIASGPWVDLFTTVNPEMTKSQLWIATWVNLGTEGETFWVLEGRGDGAVVNEKEIPTEIWPYPPKGWKPRIDKRTGRIEGWVHEYTVEGRPKKDKFEPWQVIRWYRYNPTSIRGLASLRPALEELRGDHKARVYNEAFFDQGGSPASWIEYPDELDAEDEQDLLEMYEERYLGDPQKHHRPMVLSGGVKLHKDGITHRDMEFPKLRDLARDASLATAGTPRAVLGIVEDFNRANLQATLANWWHTRLIPDTHYAEDLLDAQLFTPERTGDNRSTFGVFDLSNVEALRQDLLWKLEAAQALFEMGVPLNDINERLELGLGEYDHGNIAWRPIGFEPIEVDTEGKLVPPADEGGEDDDGDEGAEEPTEDAAAGTHSRFATEEHWRMLVERIFTPGETAAQKRVRRFVMDLRSAQLRIIRDATSLESATELLFPLKPWAVRLGRDLKPVYESVYRAAEEEAREEIAAERAKAKPMPSKAETFLRQLQRDVGVVVRNQRRLLRKILRKALREKSTKEQILEAVRAAFNTFAKAHRINTVAREEVLKTVNGARVIVWQDEEVEKHEWLTEGDAVVRATHVEYGRMGPIKVGANFAKGRGYTLRYPHDPGAPLDETINCRCVTAPVV